ncbi:MAG: ornithine carbamoyltransferase [Anaerolineales bacterium]|nr:ornithine carbamoyltransferase [Anaerolineales bacterium]
MSTFRHTDLISLREYTREDLALIWETAWDLKRLTKRGQRPDLLRNKTLAMVFNMPSTRTSVSFEAAMTQLGGHAQYLFPDRIWAAKASESWTDTIGVLGRYADGLVGRVASSVELEQAAALIDIPVINASTAEEHPCQALADFMTAQEKKGDVRQRKYVFTWAWRPASPPMGLPNSSLYIASRLGAHFVLACPEGYEPEPAVWEKAQYEASLSGGQIEIVHDMQAAATDADFINVYCWASPQVFKDKFKGTDEKAPQGKAPHILDPDRYRGWIVNDDLLKRARPDVSVMHCMPAARDQEVTSRVLDGPHSIILDQAENRLHVQKGLLALLMG